MKITYHPSNSIQGHTGPATVYEVQIGKEPIDLHVMGDKHEVSNVNFRPHSSASLSLSGFT